MKSINLLIALALLSFTSCNAQIKNENHTHGTTQEQQTNQLQVVFDNYFAIKEALVNADGNAASSKAKDLAKAISAVKMETLTAEEHTAFMKVQKDLSLDAAYISETKDVSQQRNHFTTLSDNLYLLIKISKQETPVYHQHCPMYNDDKGASWLSKESAIKNPYYGSQMLTCGKTIETIK
jgi:hypothetical protein